MVMNEYGRGAGIGGSNEEGEGRWRSERKYGERQLKLRAIGGSNGNNIVEAS